MTGQLIKYPWNTPPAESHATEVADGVLWMRLPLPMALDHVNVFAFDEGDSWTIIDTGFASDTTKAIWDRLLAGPLQGKPVSRLIVTHHHPDHVGLAAWFIAKGATLLMPRTGWLTARMLTLDVQPTYSTEAITFYQRAGMAADELEQRRKERPFNFADCVAPLPLGYTRLMDGQSIHFGGRNWDVRMGDGHAPEHATFWSRDDHLIIGGDQLLSSISANLGVYPTEPEADPVQDWLTSCENFQPFARDDQLILPGHKLPFTGLPLRLRQMIENHHGALERLVRHLKEPRKASACFAPLFKRDIGRSTYGLALAETLAHLNHLHQQGVITRKLGDDGAWLWQSKSISKTTHR